MNLDIPSMLTTAEKDYLYQYAKTEFQALGEIVDLGCWLGSSTVPLAEGLQASSNLKIKERHIHAYDIFIWESWMDSLHCVKGTYLEDKFNPGESFYEECLKQTNPWREQIRFYPGDLTEKLWGGEPIEFLFIDAMKSWDLANSILHNFFPYLVPGQSLVVHQDFTHYYTYWIHLLMYRLRDYFEVVYDIPYSASLVFKYTKPIPEEVLQHVYSVESFDVDEIKAAFSHSASLVSPEKRPVIIAGKIMAFTELVTNLQKDQIDEALADLYQEISQLQGYKPQVESLQIQLDNYQQQVHNYQQQVHNHQQQVHNYQQHIQQLQAELEQLQGKVASKEDNWLASGYRVSKQAIKMLLNKAG